MPIELNFDVPGGTMRVQGTDEKAIFRQAAFWQALPTVCPIDGSPTRLEFRSPQDYEYYMVVSTGPFPFEYKLGIHNNQAKTLFNKGTWSYYDPKAKEEVVVWENGKLNKDNLPDARGISYSRPSPSTTSNPDPYESSDPPRAPQGGNQGSGVGDGPSRDEEKLAKMRSWAARQLNNAGVPDSLRGAVLTSMLGRPVHNDLTRLRAADVKEMREFLENIPDAIKNAWDDVKSKDATAAAVDGSDLDAPDFWDDDAF